MLRYYYIKERERLYVHDYESGYFSVFNQYKDKWEIPCFSFSQTEHDYDIDFVEIPEETAKEISHGVSFEEDYKAFVALLESVKASSKKKD